MKTAVMLIHGFLSDCNDFDGLYEKLSEVYDHVERFNLPGHGVEGDLELFQVDLVFTSVLYTFDELNKVYDSIDVVGYSMGGALASYLSSIRKFNRLVLLAPANKYLNAHFLYPRLRFYRELNSKEDNYYFDTEKMNDEERKEVSKKLLNDERKQDLEIIRFAFEVVKEKMLRNFSFRVLFTFMKIIKKCNSSLTTIENETLIIWGDHDFLVPYSSVEYLYNKCTHDKKMIFIIPQLNHMFFTSFCKEELINHVTNFLFSKQTVR